MRPGQLVRVKVWPGLAPALYGAQAVVVELDEQGRVFIKFAIPIEISKNFIVDALWLPQEYVAAV